MSIKHKLLLRKKSTPFMKAAIIYDGCNHTLIGRVIYPYPVLDGLASMSMYLRVKRKNTTTMLHVEASDSFQSIKQRIATLFSVESHQVMLLGSDRKKELVELATVSDQGKLIFNPLLISPSMLFFCSCCVFSA